MITLEVKERQVNLFAPGANPVGTLLVIWPVTNAVPLLQRLEELWCIVDVVVFKTEPKRNRICGATPLGGLNNLRDPSTREVIVRKMNLLQAADFLAKLRQSFRTTIVDVVFEKLQDLEIAAALAEV